MMKSPSHNGVYGNTPPFSFTIGEDRFVGMDCLPMPEHFSGAAYYILYLTRSLLRLDPPFPVAIFCKPSHQHLFRPYLRSRDKLIPVPVKNRAWRLAFYEYGLAPMLIREKVLLFYATHYICPPPHPRYRLITTVHDLGFRLHPHFYPLIKRWYFGRRIRTFLHRANAIVAVSHSTAEAIARLFPRYAARTTVIYPGTDHLLGAVSDAGDEGADSAATPPSFPYILAVNTFEKRKNIPFIVRVFELLKQQYHLPHRLVLIGHPANGYAAIRRAVKNSLFRSHILMKNSVSISELRRYYRGADMFINASEYEGFGFTPFEAIRFGCPVFLYRNNTVEEILGDHPGILDHLDAPRWAAGIARAYLDNFPCRIPEDRLKPLTWQAAAGKTLHLMDHLFTTSESCFVS